jgi:hypothetical protein
VYAPLGGGGVFLMLGGSKNFINSFLKL